MTGTDNSHSLRTRVSGGRAVFWILIGVPVVSVVMGIVVLFIAFGNAESSVSIEQAPLSKTSWQNAP